MATTANQRYQTKNASNSVILLYINLTFDVLRVILNVYFEHEHILQHLTTLQEIVCIKLFTRFGQTNCAFAPCKTILVYNSCVKGGERRAFLLLGLQTSVSSAAVWDISK